MSTTTNTASTTKAIKDLTRLSALLAKYSHRWCLGADREPSRRMYAWVDAYEAIREEQPEAFAAYCAQTHACITHTAYDCLA